MDGSRRGVFLDRDGTLIELVPYLHDPEEVRLVPGAADALRRLGEAGWARVVVTNQSGIARGYYDLEAVERVHTRMLERLRDEGAELEAIEICPHHPEYGSACDCRKPAPGMLSRAARRLGIDPARSWVIGDRWEDIAAGTAIGCRGILVLTGYGRDSVEAGATRDLVDATEIVDDLPAAIERILSLSRA
jgi:D-glycero-D-manno-heptose 1,7-bisphosphate phosphatase